MKLAISVRNIRFACVLQWGKTVAGVELPRALNIEYVILISEEIGNYRSWQAVTGLVFIFCIGKGEVMIR